MPLLRIDIFEGRTKEELTSLLDAMHDVVLQAFKVPAGDRYQIVHEHPTHHMIIEDTGLGIPRTKDVVFLQMTTRPRGREAKEKFYALLTKTLEERCGIAPSDVVVSLIENTDEDWSFGNGRAQFLTGEL